MKLLHLAEEEDTERLLPLVASFHTEMGFGTSPDHQLKSVAPLIAGSPHGAIWLIGPRRSPVGYISISFGWSIEFGGLDAHVDELYVRPAVRGRGMAGDALDGIARALKAADVRAIHLEVDRSSGKALKLYQRALFRTHEQYVLMTRKLK